MDKLTQATPESIQQAYDYCVEQRVINGLDPDPNAPPIEVRPCAVLAFERQQEADALFTAPSALPRVHAMQLRESQDREDIATALVVVSGAERVACRYAATHALRSVDAGWVKAARQAAAHAAERWMREEGGKAFRALPVEQRQAIAVHLSAAVLTDYNAMLDGTRRLAPAEYMRIVDCAK